MENLKIKINSEAESKEVQELFFELGYGWYMDGKYKNIIRLEYDSSFFMFAYFDGCLTHSGRLDLFEEKIDFKEITLEQLHEMVEPKMKEFLNSKAGYVLQVLPDHAGDDPDSGLIEVPEGADKLVLANDGILSFWVEGKQFNPNGHITNNGIDGKSYEEWANEWSPKILWQRHTHPEELPFVDDEPVSKDEKEAARWKSNRTAVQIANASLKHIGDRADTYDQPNGERSAFKTALAFNAITGHNLKESEVWLLLQILKDVRQWSRDEYHQDSAEDCIAYASLKAESLENENK